uniref:LIM zinc-binding domain-containing protein n=1 Tax=Oryzias latipes TaxID=8090 RepID=A0A3P9IFV6_ORYLA
MTPTAFQAPLAVSIRDPMVCAGCGELVCDRFFLLAAGRVWHGACLRCSLCHCELQTHASLYWRDGNIYCQQDYCRIFGGGQCARCFQPIPPSALVMRSGDLTFHPQCFSCQECDVKLLPGNLYCMQGRPSALVCLPSCWTGQVKKKKKKIRQELSALSKHCWE